MVNAIVKWVVASLIVSASIGILVWFFRRLYSTNKNVPSPSIRCPRFSIQETSLNQSVRYSQIISPCSSNPSPIGFGDFSYVTETSCEPSAPIIAPYPIRSSMPQPTKISSSLEGIVQETSISKRARPYPLVRQATFPLSDEFVLPCPPIGRRTSVPSPSSVPYPPESNAPYPPTSNDFYPSTSHPLINRSPSPPFSSDLYPPASSAAYFPVSSAPYPPATSGAYPPPISDSLSSVTLPTPPPPSYEDIEKRKF